MQLLKGLRYHNSQSPKKNPLKDQERITKKLLTILAQLSFDGLAIFWLQAPSLDDDDSVVALIDYLTNGQIQQRAWKSWPTTQSRLMVTQAFHRHFFAYQAASLSELESTLELLVGYQQQLDRAEGLENRWRIVVLEAMPTSATERVTLLTSVQSRYPMLDVIFI